LNSVFLSDLPPCRHLLWRYLRFKDRRQLYWKVCYCE